MQPRAHAHIQRSQEMALVTVCRQRRLRKAWRDVCSLHRWSSKGFLKTKFAHRANVVPHCCLQVVSGNADYGQAARQGLEAGPRPAADWRRGRSYRRECYSRDRGLLEDFHVVCYPCVCVHAEALFWCSFQHTSTVLCLPLQGQFIVHDCCIRKCLRFACSAEAVCQWA